MATKLRCAIYTRKSSEEGLEQDFNSLHAQREACEAYIRSQVGEGWSAIAAHYDDGGFSGGSMERPGLKALLDDIGAGKVDVVVVYKVDRLTRSLADFAKIVDQFDARGVSFVSVTQAFNTTTSMGRLTLNVLLSFAQFEREVTGERIRDKIAASKAKGMWMGGMPPLGYDVQERKLVINQAEAATVKRIFERYLEVDSAFDLVAELNAHGVSSKRWETRGGKLMGGHPMRRSAVFHILASRVYRGDIVHKEKVYPGLHEAIISEELFADVGAKLSSKSVVRHGRIAKAASGVLAGKLFDQTGNLMSPSFSYGRNRRVYRYYIAAGLQRGTVRKVGDDEVGRVSGNGVEAYFAEFVGRIAGRTIETTYLADFVCRIELRREEIQVVVDGTKLFPNEHPELALNVARRGLIEGELAVAERGGHVRIVVPHRFQLRGGRSWASGSQLPRTRPNTSLVKALRSVHAKLAELGSSPVAPQAWGDPQVPPTQHGRLMARLAFLAPSIQRRILDGQLPAELTLKRFMDEQIPLAWVDQEAWLEGL